jgi:hypothetical protein
MHPLRTAVVVLTLLACAPAAQAQVVDLSKYSCKDLLGVDKDTTVVIWSWLLGYYSDQDADPVIDFGKMAGLGAKLSEYCKAHPSEGIIDAAEPIYE